ncbi:MAG TPA: hypothetical protein VJ949_01775 [Cryomorphaceae bacterium]|nr:hypothetical protein [Cryomorphaceae bacterium]
MTGYNKTYSPYTSGYCTYFERQGPTIVALGIFFYGLSFRLLKIPPNPKQRDPVNSGFSTYPPLYRAAP